MKPADQPVAVKRSRVDLGLMEPRMQFECFADEVCRQFNRHSCERVTDGNEFPARFNTLTAGTSHTSIVEAPPFFVSRTAQQVAQANSNDLHLTYIIGGGAKVCRGEKRGLFGSSNLFICDDAQMFNIEALLNEEPGFKAIVIALRDEDYSNRGVREELQNDLRFAQHRLTPLLRMTLNQLARSLERANSDESLKLLAMGESLISVIAHDDEDFKNFRPTDSHVFHLIEAEIENSLSYANLNGDNLAHRLRLPKRQIQRVMASRNTTLTDYIREKRLKLAMQQLQDGAFACKSIAEIAYNCGYSEQSSFHRAFKRTFNITPGEVQRTARNNNLNSGKEGDQAHRWNSRAECNSPLSLIQTMRRA